MGNELSALTADDLRVQLEASREIIEGLIRLIVQQAEKKARKLLDQGITFDVSYQEILEKGATGYMQVYVNFWKKCLDFTLFIPFYGRFFLVLIKF